jgi:uncharacterized protein (DUF2147 family)
MLFLNFMIKRLFFLACLSMGSGLFAQSLQFSQVKLVAALETVPANKVWKIESVIYNIPHDQSGYQASTGGCGITNYRATAIDVNGIPTKVGQGTSTAAYSNLTYTHSYTRLPIWLPAGATLSGGPCNVQISVIEFTIIP